MVRSKYTQLSGALTLLEVTRQEGHQHEAPCNGKGTCGKCLVHVLEGNDHCPSGEERRHLSETQLKKGYRLACLYKPKGAVVFEWANATLQQEHAFLIEPHVQHQVSEKGARLKGRNQRYGIAVDIGTTTVVASILDLSTGETKATASRLNPQKTYGLDVLSRITFQMSHDHAVTELKTQILATLQDLIETLCTSSGLQTNDLLEITVAANTAMLHFLLGLSAATLGKAPYHSLVKGAYCLSARELGLECAENTVCYLLPPVSAYIGGDISSGILTLEEQTKSGKHLFIDIGTNGEIVLFNEGSPVACSCAAGPAFEGMNLSFGMRAEPGAVETIRFLEDGNLEVETIGGTPKGICGSGVFDLMSEVIRCGLLGKTGRIKAAEQVRPEMAAFISEWDGKRCIQLNMEGQCLHVQQNDIRQIQLAKGAVRSGIEALLNHFNLKYDELDSVLIAGQFGKHLKQDSLVGIGLIPAGLKHKVHYLGNTAKTGAEHCLMDDRKKQEIENLVHNVHYLELADLEGYERLFVACLNVEEEA